MSTHVPTVPDIDARGRAFGIAAARYNAAYVEALLERCLATLRASGAPAPTVVRVPGSSELPVAIQALADQHRFDALIALGVLIRGDTIHYEVIAQASAQALQSVALATRTPVINGVLTVENEAQAADRCQGAADRGAEFAHAALAMADLIRKIRPNA